MTRIPADLHLNSPGGQDHYNTILSKIEENQKPKIWLGWRSWLRIDSRNSIFYATLRTFVGIYPNINKEYISKAFDYFWRLGVPIHISNEELNSLAKYPESFRCRGSLSKSPKTNAKVE